MPLALLRLFLITLFLVSLVLNNSGAQCEEWCIADRQFPDEELQSALDWACGPGGADCEMILPNQPCFFPDTVKDHASFAFNDYYQKYKHLGGGTCYFNAAALITHRDPSHGSCKFEYLA